MIRFTFRMMRDYLTMPFARWHATHIAGEVSWREHQTDTHLRSAFQLLAVDSSKFEGEFRVVDLPSRRVKGYAEVADTSPTPVLLQSEFVTLGQAAQAAYASEEARSLRVGALPHARYERAVSTTDVISSVVATPHLSISSDTAKTRAAALPDSNTECAVVVPKLVSRLHGVEQTLLKMGAFLEGAWASFVRDAPTRERSYVIAVEDEAPYCSEVFEVPDYRAPLQDLCQQMLLEVQTGGSGRNGGVKRGSYEFSDLLRMMA